MGYALVKNAAVVEYPYSIAKLRKDNPNTSFPKRIPEDTLNSFGMFPVTYAASPACNTRTHKVSTAETPVLVDGVWTVARTVVALSPEEADLQATQYAQVQRTTRDQQLADSDWTQTADAPLTATQKADWARYRAELRDVTSHTDWPFVEGENWPTPPEE